MGSTLYKEELLKLIKEGDNELIKLLHSVAKEYTQEDYLFPGEPMNESTLRDRIRSAKSRILAGQFTTQADLESEMEGW